MRSAVEIQLADGHRLLGTRHEPADGAADVGILIVNFGPIPRSGVGDLAVRLADALCDAGRLVYRIDLPGIGDSDGDLPPREEPYFESLQRGAHADLVAGVAGAIAVRHGLRGGVVAVGLCSGTWIAGYAAERTDAISGLVMLEPELRTAPYAGTEGVAGRIASRVNKAISPLAWVRFLFGENCLSSRLGVARSFAYWTFLRMVGSSMPTDTYWPLVASWKALARRRLPVFVVTSARSWREMYVLRALAWLDRRAPSHRITHEAISGTNHIFTAGGGTVRVLATVIRWISESFPVNARDGVAEVGADV